MDVRLSVALVTRNRPQSLARTLESLRAQERQPYEVLVSDDSDPRYSSASQLVALDYGCRYVLGPRRGLYANRNSAAAACTGTHIRSMDDDNEFPLGHMERVVEAIESDPAAIWTIGQCRPEFESSGEGFRCPPQLHPRGHSTWPTTSTNIWALNDAATIYPVAIFCAGHTFADDFPFGAAYLEFGSRLRWLGYRIRHLRTTYVISHTDFGRSFNDHRLERASRMFAGLCHAFIYQPTLQNRFQAVSQALIQCILGGPQAWKDMHEAWRAYLRRRHVSADNLNVMPK